MKLLQAQARLHTSAEARTLDVAQERTNRLFDQLGNTGKPSVQKALARKIVFSFDVKLAFSYLAATKKKSLWKLNFDDVRHCAETLDLLSHTSEPVTCSARVVKQRPRTLMSFQHRKYTAQLIAGAILTSAIEPLPYQYGRRGVNAAHEAVDAQAANGMRFAVEIDISNFYPSVTLAGLAELLAPLPRRMVEHAVWTGPRTQFLGTSFYNDQVVCAQHLPPKELACLAQGSAASMSVGEIIIGRIIDSMPQGTCALSYSDNVILFGVSKAHVEQTIRAFVDRASDHAAGALGVKVKEIADLENDHFAFLGCVRRPGTCGPSNWVPKSYLLNEIDELFEREALDLETIHSARARLTSWLGQYKFWDERFEWINRRLAALAAYEGLLVDCPIVRSMLARMWLDYWTPDAGLLDVVDLSPPPSSDPRLAMRRQRMIEAITNRVSLSPSFQG